MGGKHTKPKNKRASITFLLARGIMALPIDFHEKLDSHQSIWCQPFFCLISSGNVQGKAIYLFPLQQAHISMLTTSRAKWLHFHEIPYLSFSENEKQTHTKTPPKKNMKIKQNRNSLFSSFFPLLFLWTFAEWVHQSAKKNICLNSLWQMTKQTTHVSRQLAVFGQAALNLNFRSFSRS